MNNLDINKIKNNIQLLLNKSHTDVEKRKMRIKNYGSRPLIEIACPICGDSHSVLNKKRGNLYLNNMYYICYNCGEKIGYIDLLNRFGLNVDLEDKLKIYDHVDKYGKNNVHNKNSDLSKLDKIMDLNEVIEHYNNKKNILYDIQPVQKNSAVYQYLYINRKINNFDNIYEGIYKITDKWFEPVMIILNKYDDKLLGFQIRNLKDDKKKRLYKIFDFNTIHNYVYENKPLSNEESLPYDKLSHFYNILNVDFYNKITVFEGYLDSIFVPNSIGTTGVETDYSFLLENDELDIRFFYDNDRAGNKKSMEKIQQGYSVFLWKKFFEKLSNGNPVKKIQLNNKIKDLNDVAKLSSKSNIYKDFNIEDYFSIDIFDKLYI